MPRSRASHLARRARTLPRWRCLGDARHSLDEDVDDGTLVLGNVAADLRELGLGGLGER